MSEIERTEITMNHFYNELRERVSVSNARLLLNAAVVKSGVNTTEDGLMNKDDVQTICLELIKNGGPAFQVGKSIYHQIQ